VVPPLATPDAGEVKSAAAATATMSKRRMGLTLGLTT
jgi:hypothetical protein